jgi:hypothetical protein
MNISLPATRVFETFWRFAAERQRIYVARLRNEKPPWTVDPILSQFRFTNPYRATDRVSQYLIRQVQYAGSQLEEDLFFRTLLFKIFNKIETWQWLEDKLGPITAKTFNPERYSAVLEDLTFTGSAIYSGAYIMPSGGKDFPRKHVFHLHLLHQLLKTRTFVVLRNCKSLEEVFVKLRGIRSFGSFLAFQYAIDLNYSELLDFDEMEFVVAGPGALRGIAKCFDSRQFSPEAIIRYVTENQDSLSQEFGYPFPRLGNRRLMLIDVQNLFCEVDKYARVAHPEYASARNRIKQSYKINTNPLELWLPPKWKFLLQGGDYAPTV